MMLASLDFRHEKAHHRPWTAGCGPASGWNVLIQEDEAQQALYALATVVIRWDSWKGSLHLSPTPKAGVGLVVEVNERPEAAVKNDGIVPPFFGQSNPEILLGAMLSNCLV